jgi:polyisoprenoid-binding protein YceI
MTSRNAGGTIFKKLANFFGVAAMLLAICTGSWTFAGAQSPSTPLEENSKAQALPPPGTYKIDPAHSFAYFSAWHHLVGRVRGRFDQVTGTINVSPDLGACSIDVTIDPSTISTQVSRRDEDLRSDAYFDVKKFLTMTYQGRGIHRISADLWRIDGSLTIHGVTKVVPLTFKFNGTFSDTKPNEPARVAFHGTAATKRAEFGIGARDNAAEVGDSTVPDVDIEIDVEADASH